MPMLTLMRNHWRSLLFFVLLIAAIQALGSYSTFQSVPTWYAGLSKPFWSPPNWLFGPVWTMLYLMLAISGWLLWVRTPERKMQQPVIRYYFFQLFFNALWSPLFFWLRHPDAALACLLLLDLFAVLTLVASFRQNHKAVGWMFVPYCAWVFFATTLNAAIVYLNWE